MNDDDCEYAPIRTWKFEQAPAPFRSLVLGSFEWLSLVPPGMSFPPLPWVDRWFIRLPDGSEVQAWDTFRCAQPPAPPLPADSDLSYTAPFPKGP